VATEGNRTAETAVREGRALGAESARAAVPGAAAPHGNGTVCGTAQLRRPSDAVFLIFYEIVIFFEIIENILSYFKYLW
jgi:hypothetical protein